ncbi:hypothetical protein ACFQ38_09625 [Sporosarcina contaminans]|uniref:DUF3953 domain-containing protein n=1 Tax=Sporosarcina contaminans TaxID=633403 RepID=A0ABW3TY82_9BACL
MNNIWSLMLVVVGLFLSTVIFSPLNIPFLMNWYTFFIGILLYIVGFSMGIVAIKNKEKGFLKYITVLSLVIFLIVIYFVFSLVGQV